MNQPADAVYAHNESAQLFQIYFFLTKDMKLMSLKTKRYMIFKFLTYKLHFS